MDREDIERALRAYENIDATLTFIRNMMNEPDELVALNIPSFKSDIDAMIKDMRLNGAVTKQALQSALDDYVFDEKCVKCNNRIYIKNGFVRQPLKDKEK